MITQNPVQAKEERQFYLEDQARVDEQKERERRHEIEKLKLQHQLKLDELQLKLKGNNKLKRPVIHAMTLLSLFNRTIPDSFKKILE